MTVEEIRKLLKEGAFVRSGEAGELSRMCKMLLDHYDSLKARYAESQRLIGGLVTHLDRLRTELKDARVVRSKAESECLKHADKDYYFRTKIEDLEGKLKASQDLERTLAEIDKLKKELNDARNVNASLVNENVELRDDTVKEHNRSAHVLKMFNDMKIDRDSWSRRYRAAVKQESQPEREVSNDSHLCTHSLSLEQMAALLELEVDKQMGNLSGYLWQLANKILDKRTMRKINRNKIRGAILKAAEEADKILERDAEKA